MNLMTGGNQAWHQLPSDRSRRTTLITSFFVVP
jgi:hypothetical protein